MKKTLSVLLAVALLLGAWTISCGAAKVVPSKQKLSVDGTMVKCEIYNIDGNNYFKLRDLAQLLNGTEAQFSVTWNETMQSIMIQTTKPYTPVGGELQIGEDKSATAKLSEQAVIINGKTADNLTVYNIGGNNYFQIRQLGELLYFKVDYNAVADTVAIFGELFMECQTC